MKELKFRTPVICQNGHKSFWHLVPSDVIIPGHKTIIYPVCDCSSPRRDQWSICGVNQMFIGLHSKDEIEIYDQDIITAFTNLHLVVEFHHGAFGYWIDTGKPWMQFISFCQNSNFTNSGTRVNEIEIIGSTHLTPELIP